MLSPRVWALDASVRGSYERFIDFFGNVALAHDQFVHKYLVITGNVTKPNRKNKNPIWSGIVTKPTKSELEPPLAQGDLIVGATFFLYPHAPPTTQAP